MGKQKYDGIGTRKGVSQTWNFDPFALLIVGLDVPPNESNQHLLCDRAKQPPREELVVSIMEHGILQPIKVTSIGGLPHVVMGRGRVVAAREARRRFEAQGTDGLPMVPAVDGSGEALTLARQVVVENEIRTADDPVNRARKMQRLRDLGASPEMIGKDFGMSAANVRQQLKLLDLDAEVQTAVSTGAVPAGAATQLAKLPVDQQRAAVAKVAKAVEAVQAAKPPCTRTGAVEVARRRRAPKGASAAKVIAEVTKVKGRLCAPPVLTVRAVALLVEGTEGSAGRDLAQSILWARGIVSDEDAPVPVREALEATRRAGKPS